MKCSQCRSITLLWKRTGQSKRYVGCSSRVQVVSWPGLQSRVAKPFVTGSERVWLCETTTGLTLGYAWMLPDYLFSGGEFSLPAVLFGKLLQICQIHQSFPPPPFCTIQYIVKAVKFVLLMLATDTVSERSPYALWRITSWQFAI